MPRQTIILLDKVIYQGNLQKSIVEKGTLAKPINVKSSNKSKKDEIPVNLNYNNKDVWSPSKQFFETLQKNAKQSCIQLSLQ